VLVRAKPPLATQVAEAVSAIEVPDTSVGLLIVDGEFTRVLEPGLHAARPSPKSRGATVAPISRSSAPPKRHRNVGRRRP
jgi:hypothetical protein